MIYPIIFAHGFAVLYLFFFVHINIYTWFIGSIFLPILYRATSQRLGQSQSLWSNLEGYGLNNLIPNQNRSPQNTITWEPCEYFGVCTVIPHYSMLTGWSSFLFQVKNFLQNINTSWKFSILSNTNLPCLDDTIIEIFWELMLIYGMGPLNLETLWRSHDEKMVRITTWCFIIFMIKCHIFSPFQVKLCSGLTDDRSTLIQVMAWCH